MGTAPSRGGGGAAEGMEGMTFPSPLPQLALVNNLEDEDSEGLNEAGEADRVSDIRPARRLRVPFHSSEIEEAQTPVTATHIGSGLPLSRQYEEYGAFVPRHLLRKMVRVVPQQHSWRSLTLHVVAPPRRACMRKKTRIALTSLAESLRYGELDHV